jgi:hypothetical protein
MILYKNIGRLKNFSMNLTHNFQSGKKPNKDDSKEPTLASNLQLFQASVGVKWNARLLKL